MRETPALLGEIGRIAGNALVLAMPRHPRRPEMDILPAGEVMGLGAGQVVMVSTDRNDFLVEVGSEGATLHGPLMTGPPAPDLGDITPSSVLVCANAIEEAAAHARAEMEMAPSPPDRRILIRALIGIGALLAMIRGALVLTTDDGGPFGFPLLIATLGILVMAAGLIAQRRFSERAPQEDPVGNAAVAAAADIAPVLRRLGPIEGADLAQALRGAVRSSSLGFVPQPDA